MTKYRPFCSKHCADVDLGRWFNGTYTTPADTDEDRDEALAALEKASNNLH
ncbi:DNA gyrase inhibitor YacG [Profundibacter sp.]